MIILCSYTFLIIQNFFPIFSAILVKLRSEDEGSPRYTKYLICKFHYFAFWQLFSLNYLHI